MDDTKLYLNIQEQVEKNKKDIRNIQLGAITLGEFGIKVVFPVLVFQSSYFFFDFGVLL